ncbi:hypothetical protein [Candidatus Finniella inopinata]|uniref:Uncharacterized protein n=1 Tax=Candidatus Finniella inopinata TaxID=1696036 RepID=A0A4Q7DJT0_9PROT|nr:hypothetical protein [Candidatus Finniella inopinata]RZI46608.1 hypothetical protein EQU50_03205 [Candidatus Finniella inopinata]
MTILRVLTMVLCCGLGAAASTIGTSPTIQESDKEEKYELPQSAAASSVASTNGTLPTIQESEEEAKYELAQGAAATTNVAPKKEAPLTQEDFNAYCAKEFRIIFETINKHNRFTGDLHTQSKAWEVITFLKMPFFAKKKGIPFSAALQDLIAVGSKTEFDCFGAQLLPVWSLLRLDATDIFISDLEQKDNDFQFILISGQIVQYLQKMLDHCPALIGEPAHPDDLKKVDLLKKNFKKTAGLLPRSEIVPRNGALPTDVLGGVLYLSSVEGIDAEGEKTPEKGQYLYCVDAIHGLYSGFGPFFKAGPKTLFELATDHERRVKAEISAAAQDAEKWYRNQISISLQKQKIKEKKIKAGTHALQYLTDPSLHTYYIKPANWNPPPDLEISDAAKEKTLSTLSKEEALDATDESPPPSTQEEYNVCCAKILHTLFSLMNQKQTFGQKPFTQSPSWETIEIFGDVFFLKKPNVLTSHAIQDLMQDTSKTQFDSVTAEQIGIWSILPQDTVDNFVKEYESVTEPLCFPLISEHTLSEKLQLAEALVQQRKSQRTLSKAELKKNPQLSTWLDGLDDTIKTLTWFQKSLGKLRGIPRKIQDVPQGKNFPYETVQGGAIYLPGVGEEELGPSQGLSLFCVDIAKQLYISYDPLFVDGPKSLFDIATELERRAKSKGIKTSEWLVTKTMPIIKKLIAEGRYKKKEGVHPLQFLVEPGTCCFFVIPAEWEGSKAKVKPKEIQSTDAMLAEGGRLVLKAVESSFTTEGFSDYYTQKNRQLLEDAWESYCSVTTPAQRQGWTPPQSQQEYDAYCAQTRLEYLLTMNKNKSYDKKPFTKSDYWYVETVFGISFFFKKRHYPTVFAFSDLVADDSMTKFDDQSLRQTLNWVVLPHITSQLFIKHCEDEDKEFFLPLIDGPTIETLGKFATRDHDRLSGHWNMDEEWQKFRHLQKCFNKIKNFVPSAQRVQQDGSFPLKTALGGSFYLPNVEEITGAGIGVNLFRVGEDSYIGLNEFFKDGPQTIDTIGKYHASIGISVCLCKRQKVKDYFQKLMAPIEKLIQEEKIKEQKIGTHALQYHVNSNTCQFMPYQEKAWQNEVVLRRFHIG